MIKHQDFLNTRVELVKLQKREIHDPSHAKLQLHPRCSPTRTRASPTRRHLCRLAHHVIHEFASFVFSKFVTAQHSAPLKNVVPFRGKAEVPVHSCATDKINVEGSEKSQGLENPIIISKGKNPHSCNFFILALQEMN